jgi:ElaB/YqjD/DUF883 family membrane-anchored ribosome-binding protein
MSETKDRLKGAIDTAADKAKQATDYAAQSVQSGKHTGERMMGAVSNVAEQAKEKVKDWTSDAADTARQASDKVQKWAGDAYDATAEKVGDFGQEMTSLIRKHPIPSLLIGFGVGLLLGRVARS